MRPRRSATRIRRNTGRLDLVVIAVICVLLVGGLIYVLFQIIGHSEEHVEKVRKTKIAYSESLRWRKDNDFSANRIRQDLISKPKQKVAEYSDLNLDEECMKMIGKMFSLEELKLTRSTVQDAWLEYLTPLQRLQLLGLSGTPLTDAGIQYLLKMPALNQVSLGDTEVTDQGMKTLSASTTIQIVELHLGRCVTNDGIKYLGDMKQLTQLDLASPVKINSGCLAYLTNAKQLNSLNLDSMTIKSADLRALASLPKLTHLDVSNCALDDASVAELAKAKSLLSINLSGSQISDKGLMSLAKLKKLEVLIMKECPNVTKEGVAKFRSLAPKCDVRFTKTSMFSDKVKSSHLEMDLQFLQDEVKNEMKKAKPDDGPLP